MRHPQRFWSVTVGMALIGAIGWWVTGGAAVAAPAWSIKADVAESCSCSPPCPCVFGEDQIGHRDEHDLSPHEPPRLQTVEAQNARHPAADGLVVRLGEPPHALPARRGLRVWCLFVDYMETGAWGNSAPQRAIRNPYA